jgi:hypothetical protein
VALWAREWAPKGAGRRLGKTPPGTQAPRAVAAAGRALRARVLGKWAAPPGGPAGPWGGVAGGGRRGGGGRGGGGGGGGPNGGWPRGVLGFFLPPFFYVLSFIYSFSFLSNLIHSQE